MTNEIGVSGANITAHLFIHLFIFTSAKENTHFGYILLLICNYEYRLVCKTAQLSRKGASITRDPRHWVALGLFVCFCLKK